MKSRIVFENEYFVAADKPHGWLSVAGRFNPSDCLLHQLSEAKGFKLYPIHRLDQPVSGLCLFAKSSGPHRAASLWFEKRIVNKTYEALTEGTSYPTKGERFEWKSFLVRGKKRAYEREFGKLAVTEAVFLDSIILAEARFGHWQLHPRTGRPHQLRYELGKSGHPIWGDGLYGARQDYPIGGGIALRAVRLAFPDDRKSWNLPEKIEVCSILDEVGSVK